MNLKSLYSIFARHPEGQWIMQWPNAQDLYNFIKNNKIKRVLSLGTGIGCSDAVVALSFEDKGEKEGMIDSIEQYDKCIKIANQLIPENLKKYINIHKSNPKVLVSEKVPYQFLSIYEKIPDEQYDLIINDGPSPFLDELGNFAELPNGTIHQMLSENKINPGTFIIYDGRVSSLSLLERYFGNNFYLIKVPPKGSDFVVLQRKEGELIVEDERLKAFNQNSNYFKNHEK